MCFPGRSWLVTAEDMRGVEVLSDEQPFDLRREGGPEAEESYIRWNIAELDKCPALRGRTFDLIISWVTWIWVSDPLGALELVFDRFLAPDGILIIGGMQLLTHQNSGPCKDQRWLFSLRDMLVEQVGHQIETFADASLSVLTWWVQRKPLQPETTHLLGLGRFMGYDLDHPFEEDSQKAIYEIAANGALLGPLAATYDGGTGGAYPLPPAPAEGARPIPSARLRKNDAALDDASRRKMPADLDEYRRLEDSDLSTLLARWIAT
ncbi:unnamed protein product [Polarella glacialis]|uniref:Uncharacterized protein n=1 Tax=Polarella glacialis TaxID=89957 RepID=A0A813IWY4_POLGL|nr:unnamed protein product [Polarella glacialis]